MNNRRKLLVAFGAGALAPPLGALAQQKAKVYRIGILFSTTPAAAKPQVDAFMQGLQELGYVEHKNVTFEHRYAEGIFERLPAMVSGLVHKKST